MIIGRDLLQQLHVIIDFCKKTIEWEGVALKMPTNTDSSRKPLNYSTEKMGAEPESTKKVTERVERILDAV